MEAEAKSLVRGLVTTMFIAAFMIGCMLLIAAIAFR
jgi:hypothetical protein